MREWLFRLAVALDFLLVFDLFWFWRTTARWDGLMGHVNDLASWAVCGFCLACFAFILSMFGKRWARWIAAIASVPFMYFWYQQAQAI